MISRALRHPQHSSTPFHSVNKLNRDHAKYLLINLDVNLTLLSAAPNQHYEFMELLESDWLSPKVRQD